VTIAEPIEQSALADHSHVTLRDAAVLALPFLFLTLVLFAGLLFAQSGVAITHAGGDLTSQFRYWNQFGFSQLRQGHIPLWNPHTYAGYPFFGNWQTALLYPINWLNLFLPWYVAVNWVVAIHFFLTGWFTSLWCRYRKISPIGSILAGVIAVGGGGYFLHIYAGHITFVCAAAWSPLIFLCVDGMVREPNWWWVRLGTIAVAFQILAGFPQIVYYTALLAGIYTLLQLPRASRPIFPIAGLLVIAIGAVSIAAVQIAVGLDTAADSVRGGGATYALASQYPLTLENIATLVMPHYLGDMSDFHPYYGRWFLWEGCIFVGSSGLCLALLGMFDNKNRDSRHATILCILAFILALGPYTFLFPILYKYVPLYGNFRDSGRFGFFVTLFLGVLAGYGYDRLRLRFVPRPWLAILFLLPGLAAIAFSLWMSQHPALNDKLWDTVMDRLWATGQTMLPARVHIDPKYRQSVPDYTNRQFLFAGASLMLVGVLLFLIPRRRWAASVLAVLAAIEILAFDIHNFDTQLADIHMPANWRAEIASVPRDQRVYIPSLIFIDSGAAWGHNDIWGYDPFMPRRYAEFMAMTQGKDPDTTGYDMGIHKLSPLLKMVRLGVYVNEHKPATRISDPLPEAQIVYEWNLTPTRAQTFSAMQAPSFDPSKTVLLETPPNPLPNPTGGPAAVSITHQTTDSMEITANLPKPGILLITDAYAKGWRAREANGADDKILPADWILRGIPLSAGSHTIELTYAPRSFTIGLIISSLAIPLFAMWCIIPAVRRRD
jgi:hypothetical protein